MKKTCKQCNIEKELTGYEQLQPSSYKGKRYEGIYYRSICKACKSMNVLQKYNENREVEVVKLRERARAKRKSDPSIHRYNNKAFKKHIKQATPKWANKKLLKRIYDNKPVGYDVDHIVPLKGKLVSGLHIPLNLQYLPSDINRNLKRNKLDYNVSTSALQPNLK